MPLLSWEKGLVCPYEPICHSNIPTESWIKHLVKCRRNHPGSKISICNFNSSHHIPDDQMVEHERNCPDRSRFLYAAAFSARSRSPIRSSLGTDEPPKDDSDGDDEMEENWENELVKSSYDPSKAAASKAVLRKIEGATPSQRRDFRRREKERHEQLQMMKTLEKGRAKEAERHLVQGSMKNGANSKIQQGRGILFKQMKLDKSQNVDVNEEKKDVGLSSSGVATNRGADVGSNKYTRDALEERCGEGFRVQKKGVSGSGEQVFVVKGRGKITWKRALANQERQE